MKLPQFLGMLYTMSSITIVFAHIPSRQSQVVKFETNMKFNLYNTRDVDDDYFPAIMSVFHMPDTHINNECVIDDYLYVDWHKSDWARVLNMSERAWFSEMWTNQKHVDLAALTWIDPKHADLAPKCALMARGYSLFGEHQYTHSDSIAAASNKFGISRGASNFQLVDFKNLANYVNILRLEQILYEISIDSHKTCTPSRAINLKFGGNILSFSADSKKVELSNIKPLVQNDNKNDELDSTNQQRPSSLLKSILNG